MKRKLALQFRIELLDTEPVIWRQIEVPSAYSFWDLHVAVQDSMGWLDYHLHEFSIQPPRKRRPVLIGIPDGEGDPLFQDVLPGWKVPLSDYFTTPGDVCTYNYDFGDDWYHEILLEGVLLQKDGIKYPICTDGERACPVEDCGGIPGYYHLLEVLADRKHEEYRDMVSWLKNHAKNYHPYNSEHFEPRQVTFSNPRTRLKSMMQA